MYLATFLLFLTVSEVFSHPFQRVKRPSIDDIPKKIVELIEFSMPSSPSVNEFVPSPYEFGYEFGNGKGMQQHRSESADEEGVVKGVYGYLDPLGVYRSVEYTADSDGYRAIIRTNEPGSVANDIPHVKYIVATPPAAALEQGLLYKQEEVEPETENKDIANAKYITTTQPDIALVQGQLYKQGNVETGSKDKDIVHAKYIAPKPIGSALKQGLLFKQGKVEQGSIAKDITHGKFIAMPASTIFE